MKFRAFISFDLGALPELVEIENSIKDTKADLKLVEPENIHLTLKFLGDTDESIVDDTENIMRKVIEGIEPFEIVLKGLGVFPNLNYMRVIWVGIENAERLAKIAKRLDIELERLEFKREKRKFSPHITLGRVKSQRNKELLQHLLKENVKREFTRVVVDNIRLKKSILTSKGPEYTTVREVRFEQ